MPGTMHINTQPQSWANVISNYGVHNQPKTSDVSILGKIARIKVMINFLENCINERNGEGKVCSSESNDDETQIIYLKECIKNMKKRLGNSFSSPLAKCEYYYTK